MKCVEFVIANTADERNKRRGLYHQMLTALLDICHNKFNLLEMTSVSLSSFIFTTTYSSPPATTSYSPIPSCPIKPLTF